jgi:hypothetical protein
MTKTTEIAAIPAPKLVIDEAEHQKVLAMPTDRLKAELSKALEMTARSLMRLALIVRTLEERGEDLSDLRLGILGYLRQIAHGQVLPQVVVRFGGSPTLVRAVASLPAPDQRRLAAGEPVLMAVREGDRYTHRMVDPLRMSATQVRQVFGPDRIRDESEQILRLQARAASEPSAPKKSQAKGKIAIDPKGRGIRVNRTLVPTALLVELLAEMGATPETDDPAEVPVVLKLTEREHYSLKRAALDSGTSVVQLGRRALRVAGLLAGPGPED